MRSLTLFSLVLALSACGDDGGTTDATGITTSGSTGSGSTGSGSTGSESGTGEPTTSGASTDASTGADASTSAPATATSTSSGTTTGEPGSTSDATTGDASSTGESTGDSTTGATSELVIAVFDAELYADCMPEIEPDPVQGSWYVQFDNTGGGAETSAVLTKASLSLLVADPPVLEEISVSPTESGPIAAGEQIEVVVKKLKGAAHSGCDHCGEFYLLALEYQEGDVIHQVTEEVTISCAF
jgi:hypothetical protein